MGSRNLIKVKILKAVIYMSSAYDGGKIQDECLLVNTYNDI